MSDSKDMIYGMRAVMEAIHAGRPIDKVLIQKGLTGDNSRELTQLIRERELPMQLVPPEKLNRLTQKNHQGVVCFVAQVNFATLSNLVARAFEEGRNPFILILDRITDVRNFGAIVRTAECAGIDAIVIGDKGNAPLSSDSMKTSAGALHHIPVCRERDLREACRFLRESGIQVVACTEKAESSIYEVEFNKPTAIILGSEEDGISDSLVRGADLLVKIPLRGKIGSLNVSVAAAIAMYEAVRQQHHTLPS